MTVKFYDTDDLKFMVTPVFRYDSDSPKTFLHFNVWVLNKDGEKMFCKIKDLTIRVNCKTIIGQYDIQQEMYNIAEYISSRYGFKADDYAVEKRDDGLVLTPINPEKQYMCSLWNRTRGKSFFFDDEEELAEKQKRYRVDVSKEFINYRNAQTYKLMDDIFGSPLDDLNF